MTVRRLFVPAGTASATGSYLIERGRLGLEGFALWAGVCDSAGSAAALALWVPESEEFGTGLAIRERSMVDFAQMLNRSGWRLLAQVHSHPGQAFHSAVDERYPASGRDGFLSVVFARFGTVAGIDGIVVYERAGAAWRVWNAAETAERIVVIPHRLH